MTHILEYLAVLAERHPFIVEVYFIDERKKVIQVDLGAELSQDLQGLVRHGLVAQLGVSCLVQFRFVPVILALNLLFLFAQSFIVHLYLV